MHCQAPIKHYRKGCQSHSICTTYHLRLQSICLTILTDFMKRVLFRKNSASQSSFDCVTISNSRVNYFRKDCVEGLKHRCLILESP